MKQYWVIPKGVIFVREDDLLKISLRRQSAIFREETAVLAKVFSKLNRPILFDELINDIEVNKRIQVRQALFLLYERGFTSVILAENELIAEFLFLSHDVGIIKPNVSLFPLAEPISLPMSNCNSDSLAVTLPKRSSASSRSNTPLDITAIALLLYSAYGLNGTTRTVPSAGGLYPLDVYVYLQVTHDAYQLFQYGVATHSLIPIGSCTNSICELCNQQATTTNAKGLVLFFYNPIKNVPKYGSRGLYFALIESGHAAQNLLLAATQIGLGTRCIGSLNKALIMSISGDFSKVPIYAVAIY